MGRRRASGAIRAPFPFADTSLDRLRSIAELERINRAGWPPLDHERLGGWELRFSGGYSKRANSANPMRGADSLERHLPAIEHRFAARGLVPVFRLTPLAPETSDTFLADAGYRMVDPSPVMLAPLTAADAPDRCEFVPRSSREWLDGFASASALAPAGRTAHEAIVAGIGGHVSHVLRRDAAGRSVGFGIAVLAGPGVVISDIVVDPAERRRGHARAMMVALMEQGRRTGAAFALLNTRAANAPALALYAGLGFAEVYRYHYRVAPAELASQRP